MNEPVGLVEQATAKDPRAGLQAVAALRRLLERLERIHVENARGEGWTWQEIAGQLGVSKQAVHQKHKEQR
jgi:DNA-directed RNA polymerase specialized sigma24 family protein